MGALEEAKFQENPQDINSTDLLQSNYMGQEFRTASASQPKVTKKKKNDGMI